MNEISDELDIVFFGDRRLDERSKNILNCLYNKIGNGLGASFGGNSEIKAAYRFFDNDLVNPEKILKPHYKKTIERIKEHKVVGFSQDTSEIDMKHMENVTNLGVLNDIERPGCPLHPVIAFTPDKLCLGVVDVKFLHRTSEKLGKKAHNNLRKIEDKESLRWIKGYQVASEIAEQCPETLCVSIGDRESDIYELMVAAMGGKAKIIIRAWHNRSILLPPSENILRLLEKNQELIKENKNLAKRNEKIRYRKGVVGDYEKISLQRKANDEERNENSNRIKKNNKLIKSNNEPIPVIYPSKKPLGRMSKTLSSSESFSPSEQLVA